MGGTQENRCVSDEPTLQNTPRNARCNRSSRHRKKKGMEKIDRNLGSIVAEIKDQATIIRCTKSTHGNIWIPEDKTN